MGMVLFLFLLPLVTSRGGVMTSRGGVMKSRGGT